MTADEYVAVNFRLWKKRPRTLFNHLLLGMAILLLSVGVYQDITRSGYVTNWSGVVFLAVAVLYAGVRMAIVRYELRRGYAKNTGLHHPINFTFDLETLCGSSADGRFEARWRTLRRAVWVRPNWLLLYPTEAACYYVDLRQIQAPNTPEHLLALVRDAKIAVREV